MVKKVAVIGGGISGLIATKICIEEGLEPICFEKSDDICGLWNYHETVEHGRPSVYATTTINTSKEFMAFSDYPAPKDAANYMHHSELLKYFKSYVDAFGLMKFVKLRHNIENVEPTDDHDKNGCWKLRVTNLDTNEKQEICVNFVLVATGHHCFPRIPTFKGLNDFKGTVIHTHDYKTPFGYKDKSVLVIGVGNSGLDTVVDISRLSKQAYLSTRRGVWVYSRMASGGLPLDLSFTTRLLGKIPKRIFGRIAKFTANKRFDHSLYGLKPDFLPNQSHPSVCDELPITLLTGRILVKPDVAKFTEEGVVFSDGSFVKLDAVVMATGYIIKFPFLSKEIIEERNNQFPMYKYVFPPHHAHHSMAFIGFIQAVGTLNPISEMQSRYACKVFKKEISLPSEIEMNKVIKETRDEIDQWYYKSERHTIQADYQKYLDDLASIVGVYPRIFSRLFTDPKLAFALMFGPVLPYHYRIDGPNSWPKAREMTLTVWDRVKHPFNPKSASTKDSAFSKMIFPFFLLSLISAWFLKENFFM